MNTEICIIEKIERKVDIEKIYELFQDKPYSVILDSSLQENSLGQYSIIAFEPFMIFRSKGNDIELIKHGVIERKSGDPLEYLGALLLEYKFEKRYSYLPFTSGCIGYFSYDLCRFIEELPQNTKADENIPDIILGFYNNAIIIDHTHEDAYISVTSAGLPYGSDVERLVRQNVLKIKQLLKTSDKNFEDNTDGTSIVKNLSACSLESNFTKEDYCLMVKRAKEYIRNGDIYQVNLSQRFSTKISKKPYDIYEKLRKANPAPFSAYLNFDDIKVISSSPERFIKVCDGMIETRPIKGTRPRGTNPEEDKRLKEELLNSEKDRAELTMIVDLERNDLGKVCKIGTVQVDKLMEIEEYATVIHLVSTIKGELRDDVDIMDCIRAAFPGGSITGAPKIRSMEIIDELEPVKRHIYTGSIGYIGFNGNTDLNIAIRTIIVNGNEACFNVGGGIVWDSVPENEYQETLDKGKALMQVLVDG